MLTNIFRIAVLIAAVAIILAAPRASADTVTVTVTGTIASGVDRSGIFGPVGADMTGDPFTIVYTIDNSYVPLVGHPDYSANVTVNGQNLNDPIGLNCLSCSDQFFSDSSGALTQDRLVVYDPYFSISTYITGAMPLTTTMPFSYSLNPATDTSSGNIYEEGGLNTDLFLSVSNITLTNDTVSAVPEPATLPLFATGLGGLGLLGWRRKRKAQVSQ